MKTFFSIAPGNWFLSPRYILGSADPASDRMYLCFPRNLFGDLRISVDNMCQEICFQHQVEQEKQICTIDMNDWPRGEYKLYLEDENQRLTYLIIWS